MFILYHEFEYIFPFKAFLFILREIFFNCILIVSMKYLPSFYGNVPFIHNVEKWSNILRNLAVFAVFNIMCERDKWISH